MGSTRSRFPNLGSIVESYRAENKVGNAGIGTAQRTILSISNIEVPNNGIVRIVAMAVFRLKSSTTRIIDISRDGSNIAVPNSIELESAGSSVVTTTVNFTDIPGKGTYLYGITTANGDANDNIVRRQMSIEVILP